MERDEFNKVVDGSGRRERSEAEVLCLQIKRFVAARQQRRSNAEFY